MNWDAGLIQQVEAYTPADYFRVRWLFFRFFERETSDSSHAIRVVVVDKEKVSIEAAKNWGFEP